MSTYRVLSLDGGGIKGLITAIVLERLALEPAIGGWLQQADLIVGTSTGGLLALGLAHGLSPADIRNLYVAKGRKIFDDSAWDNIRDLGKLVGADYSTRGLEEELRAILGDDTTLADLDTDVLITSFDLDNRDDPHRKPDAPRMWKPKLFHNMAGEGSDGDALCWKVGLYTAAAPTYFPSVDGYVDGGVYATNPSMCALAQTRDARYGPKAELDEVVLLSLGTGTNLHHIRKKKVDWGYAQWARPLVSLMLDGVAGIADYQCRQLLGASYHRLDPLFPKGKTVAMDDVAEIPFMQRFASEVAIADTVAWIVDHWMTQL